jgi:hypothetical protein
MTQEIITNSISEYFEKIKELIKIHGAENLQPIDLRPDYTLGMSVNNIPVLISFDILEKIGQTKFGIDIKKFFKELAKRNKQAIEDGLRLRNSN